MNHAPQQCIDAVAGSSAADTPEGRREELALLAGGDLPPEEAARLEEHAAGCPACRATLAGLRESLAGLSLLAAEDLGPERPAERAALERLRAGVLAGAARIDRERQAGPRSDRRAGGAPQRWALAAVLLVALVGAALWMRSGSVPGSSGAPPERVAERPAPASARPAEPPASEPQSVPDAAGPSGPAGPAGPAEPAGPSGPSGPADRADPSDRLGPPDRLAGSAVVPEAEPAAPAATFAEDRPAAPRITIRIVSDDPDIVFYWLVEPEENRDETVSS